MKEPPVKSGSGNDTVKICLFPVRLVILSDRAELEIPAL